MKNALRLYIYLPRNLSPHLPSSLVPDQYISPCFVCLASTVEGQTTFTVSQVSRGVMLGSEGRCKQKELAICLRFACGFRKEDPALLDVIYQDAGATACYPTLLKGSRPSSLLGQERQPACQLYHTDAHPPFRLFPVQLLPPQLCPFFYSHTAERHLAASGFLQAKWTRLTPHVFPVLLLF